MSDWAGVRAGISQGYLLGKDSGGKLSGLGMVLNKVADKLKQQNVVQQELGQKQQLLGMEEASKIRMAQAELPLEKEKLGYAGAMEGKIIPAQPNEPGAINVPGIGWLKKAPSDEMEIMNRLINKEKGLLGENSTQNISPKDTTSGITSDKLLRGMVSKKYGIPYESLQTPEENQRKLDKKVEEAQALEQAKGIPTSETGKVALARESIKNIQDVKKLLFPTGKATSFKRTTAYASNLPGGNFPVLPSRGWGKAEQEVYRKMGASLAGRQLIQTGVAARPEETQKLISQFAPSLGSSSESALNGLNELENFYKDYLNTLETRGIKTKVPIQDNSEYQKYLQAIGQ